VHETDVTVVIRPRQTGNDNITLFALVVIY
jgi:hypothetical protein